MLYVGQKVFEFSTRHCFRKNSQLFCFVSLRDVLCVKNNQTDESLYKRCGERVGPVLRLTYTFSSPIIYTFSWMFLRDIIYDWMLNVLLEIRFKLEWRTYSVEHYKFIKAFLSVVVQLFTHIKVFKNNFNICQLKSHLWRISHGKICKRQHLNVISFNLLICHCRYIYLLYLFTVIFVSYFCIFILFISCPQ